MRHRLAILAVITGGHHAHRHAHARAAAGVGGQKARFAVEVVVGKLHGHVLRVGDKGRDLHGKIGIVFAGELFMRELGLRPGRFWKRGAD